MKSTDLLVTALRKWNGVLMHRSMANFISYTKGRNLSMTQVGALFTIRHKGSAGVSDLADELGITSAAASQMLERMVQQELITRTEDPGDRRLKQIVLTDKGRQVVQESIDAREGWLDQLAAIMSADEKKQVTAALDLLVEKASLMDNNPEHDC